jgi:hypothetical protein
MPNIATYFARLKHWQLFLVTGVPFFGQQLYVASELSRWSSPPSMAEFDALFTKGIIVGSIVFSIVFTWFWSISTVANNKIPNDIRPSTKLYRFVVPFTLLYIVFAALYIPQLMRVEKGAVPVGVIFPLHLVATFGMFYAFIFPAKNLVIAERGQMTPFSGYLGTLFLLWLFPLGVWFIQPRLNRLLENHGN